MKRTMPAKKTRANKIAKQMKWLIGKTAKQGLCILLALMLMLMMMPTLPAIGTQVFAAEGGTPETDDAFEIARQAFFEELANGADKLGPLETIILEDEPQIIEKPFVDELLEDFPIGRANLSQLQADELELEYTQGPFEVGDERLFDAMLKQDDYYPVKGKLVAQGEHVNVWVLDDDAYHQAVGTTHNSSCNLERMTPAASNDIANIIDGIYERMTDPDTGFAPHAHVKVNMSYPNLPYCGDIDDDGMMNFLFYPMQSYTGFFAAADFYLPTSSSQSCFLDVVHIDTTIVNTNQPLTNYSVLAHEFQHFLFYTYFGAYTVAPALSLSRSFSWINESLADLASIYYTQPGAEVLISGRLQEAASNPYAPNNTAGYYDLVNFSSTKGYGIGSSMSYLFHKATGGLYENNIYKYFIQKYPPSTTSNEYSSNVYELVDKTMAEIWGDVAEHALDLDTIGEDAFAQMYWMFMEAFATDGGTIHGDILDVPTTKLYSGTEQAGNLWTQRDSMFNSFPPLATNGAIQLVGYGTYVPSGNATHEMIYRLDAGTGPNTVLNITITDLGAGNDTKYYVALKRAGATSSLPYADIYPLTPGTQKEIYTNGKEAYLFAATLFRDVNSTLSYSWTAPNPGTLDGKIELNNYVPMPETVLIATVTPSGQYDYVWTSGGDIVGANQNSYTTTTSDIGKVISVTATSQTLTSGSLQTQTVAVSKMTNSTTPTAPVEQSKTHNSVTLEPTTGYEYSINKVLWQDSSVFGGLLPETEYSFYQRQKATDTTNASNASNASTITTLAYTPADTLVTAAAILGVTSPVALAAPSTGISNGTGFTASLEWDGAPSTFNYNMIYTATITLTAASGYTFSGDYTNTAEISGFKINGNAPSNWLSNDGSELVFKVEFPATEAPPTPPDTPIVAAAILGVTSPVANVAPSTAISDGIGFTASLEWDGAPSTFNYNMIYTATITLTAASGYTFSGDYTNVAEIAGFTVNGNAPTNWISNDGSVLVFKVEFPATEAPPSPPDTPIAAAAILGVTSPVALAAPSTDISNGTGFTAALSWDGSPPTFDYNTIYTATITLTAASGYTFSGDYTNVVDISGFTVNGNAPTDWLSNDGLELVFKVEFPATDVQAAHTFTVTYNYNNGWGPWVDPTPFSYGATANDYLTPPITNGGLVIVGWYLDPACVIAWDYIVTANITVYAKWAPISVSVSYKIEYIDNVYGASVPPAASLTNAAWTTVSTVKPISAGSTFQGWSTSPLAGSVDYMPGDWIYVDGTIILYAIWSPSHYTIKYDSTGGTPISPVDITADRWTTLSTMKPTRADGAVFVCWVTRPYTAEYAPGSWIYVDRDIDLFAVWNDSKYDVGYNYTTENGGYVWHEDALYGSEANYEFFGFNSKIAIWCKDPSCAPGTEWVYGTDKITGPTMLYAKWIPDKVTVAYHYGAASPSVVYQESVGFAFTRGTQDYGKAVDYWTHGADQFNIGLLFDGWFADASLTIPYDFSSPLTGDLSLYAKWSVATNYAIVRYDYTTEAGGYVWTEQADLNSEANYEFFKLGDKIAIWCKDASCTMPWDYAVDRITVNTTLYAKWIPAEVTVTYINNNVGFGITESEVFSFAFITGTENYDYSATTHNWSTGSDVFGNGYLFQGWYKDPGYNYPFNFGDPITGNLTLYAKWGIA